MIPDNENTVNSQVDHLFRHNAGQMVSVLCRIFGVEKIDLIEDAVQSAFVMAMKKWPFGGVPENPSAWLTQVAKNLVLDQLRRGKHSAELDAIETEPVDLSQSGETHFTAEIAEDQLRMIFACCHPSIPPDSQVALTLKIVGGFSVGEIARAYLSNNEAVAKMLTRAKTKLRSGGVALEIPDGNELNFRLDAVLRVLYLMFNEGYAATDGDELIRKDLCFEAIRLAEIVADHPVTSAPRANALAALLLFQASRLSARTGQQGELLLLADQDRDLWNKRLLSAGLNYLHQSASGDELSDYHIEAEIASLHSLSPDFASTDWNRILECYDALQSRKFSPVVELNRIVAVGHNHDSQAALEQLSGLAENYLMTSFNLFHITRAHFFAVSGKTAQAREAYNNAKRLTQNRAVLRFIESKTDSLPL